MDRDEQLKNIFRYHRYSIYDSDINIVYSAASNANLSDYWLTRKEVEEYIAHTKEDHAKFLALKKKKLKQYRLAIIGTIAFFLLIILLLLPHKAIFVFLWLVFFSSFLLAYPFFDLTKELGAVIDKKYRWLYAPDPRVDKMVDDYLWKLNLELISEYEWLENNKNNPELSKMYIERLKR